MAIVTWICWFAGAYLFGSVPFGYLVGRMRGVDVRTVGSKNIGATNVYRTVGKKWGILAFVCDFLKGYLPVLLALRFAGGGNLPVWVGVAAVVGHTLSVFMGFRGGKGVATAFGMMMALTPGMVGVAFLIFVVTVWLSHYISLGSCLAALYLGISVWWHPCALTFRILVTALAAFVILKHRANLRRLAQGCENKIYSSTLLVGLAGVLLSR